MASGSGKIKLFSSKINIITEYETQANFAPTIYQQYHRGEFIEVFNGTWFMTDLSNIDEILNKPQPLYYGLNIFDTVINETVLQYEMTGNTGEVLSGKTVDENHTLRYIDSGNDYYQTAVRNEQENYGWQPRSNTELYTTISRGDVDGWDYPEFSVRGTRKIPLSAGTICGVEDEDSNRSNYNWFFGINAGLDFNSIEQGAAPTVMSGAMTTTEGSSVISDVTGSLLFYTNGETLYTSGHTVMVNGSGLLGNTGSTQSSLIVPQPSTNKYYVFTSNYDGANNGLNYSVVNMDLQGGDGQVEAKNISLLSNGLTEKIAGAKHSNGSDYWVISNKTGDTKFYAYQVSSAGISTPVITSIGSTNNTPRGYLKVSHDSTKIVNALYDEDIIDIMDFTASAGTLSNLITITGFTFDNGPYGVEFSTDTTKLYISDGAQGKIHQFDLTLTSATDMIDYHIVVADITGNTNGSIQMGPDEKIYLSNFDGNTLHVIHHPNGLGVNCNFQEDALTLYSGTTSKWGLPNMINDAVLSCDRYIYLRPFGEDDFDFEYTLNDVTNVIQDKELNFYTEIYKYDNTNETFPTTPIVTGSVEYNEFSSTTTTTISINDIGEGEFLIKGYYNHPLHTFVSYQVDRRYNNITNRKKGDEYGLYDKTTDWYFLNMYEADTPVFNSSAPTNPAETVGLVVESTFTTSGLTAYTFDGTGDPLVSYNGSTLAPTIDYTHQGQNIGLKFEVLDNQILTIAYVPEQSSNGLYNDSITVGTINSGPSDTQTATDKVFYNTTHSKYEYYLDAEPDGGIVFTVNGSTLINGVEYYTSITNPKRVILEVTINSGDILQAFYKVKAGFVGQINTLSPTISWSIVNKPTQGQSGQFVIEVVDELDTDFENILYSATTNYIVDENVYSTIVNITSGSYGDKFLYRIKNEKRYTNILGDVITSTRYGEVIPIQISTNAVNSY
jgi:hypothetical protein